VRRLPGRLVLIGHPVAHSASPRFQNAALRAAGIPLIYETLDVPPGALEAMMAGLAQENAAGNVTIPHKEAVAERCAVLTPLAERCGAVNVFWHARGELHGDNTDVGGADVVMAALLQGRPADARVALIGAGGAAAAVLCALEGWSGARVRIYNRSRPRAERLAARFRGFAVAASSIADAIRDSMLVVNATSIGMSDAEFPVPLEELPPDSAVFDLVYRPEETAWVRAAREAGHRAADGEGMLLEQGALAFERWFGRAPDRGAMWRSMH
jgi:shikimate dehydrogenase